MFTQLKDIRVRRMVSCSYSWLFTVCKIGCHGDDEKWSQSEIWSQSEPQIPLLTSHISWWYLNMSTSTEIKAQCEWSFLWLLALCCWCWLLLIPTVMCLLQISAFYLYRDIDVIDIDIETLNWFLYGIMFVWEVRGGFMKWSCVCFLNLLVCEKFHGRSWRKMNEARK